MDYTIGDYWNATKYVWRGLGSFSDGLATAHQIRDAEKNMPDWWKSNDGPPNDGLGQISEQNPTRPMAIKDWIYEHSPQVVQNWLDQRAWDKDVAEQYDLRQKNELDEGASRLDNGPGQTPEQILKRGFLESEAHRLGLLSERIIADLKGPSIDDEAASVFDDRRKYNIEHGIPLTPSQQEEQRRVDRLFGTWEIEDLDAGVDRNEIEAELDEDEYDRAERDDDQEELGF